jgi:quercetin dioxygenase-like cupin family protein
LPPGSGPPILSARPRSGDAFRFQEEEVDMRRSLVVLMLLGSAVAATTLYQAREARATPANGFAGTTLAKATFAAIDVFNHLDPPDSKGDGHEGGRDHDRDVWLSWQKTKGSSDLYVQTNTWDPGGSTGWHTHPGHSLIIVTEGTVTAYDGDDPDCKPSVYSAGMGFVDPGGDHVHNIRNEGSIPAKTVAVQLIPAGATRRIDAADPGHCAF